MTLKITEDHRTTVFQKPASLISGFTDIKTK